MTDLVGKHILLVEDEAILAMLFQDMLEDLGAKVTGPAVAVKDAFDIIAAGGVIDLAVLDIDLAGDSSLPVALELKRRAIPFMFATGFGDRPLPELPDVPVINKPFSKDELVKTLLVLLDAATA